MTVKIIKAKYGPRRKNWWLIAATVVIVLVLFLWFWLHGKLAPRIIKQLSENSNTRIKYNSISFSPKGAVLIRGLNIKPDIETRHDNTIMTARKIYIRFGLFSLITSKPEIHKISLHDFKIDIQSDVDTGQWNIDNLKIPSGKQRRGLFKVRLKNGNFLYTTVSNSVLNTAMSIPIDGRLRPAGKNGFTFYLATAEEERKQRISRIEGHFKPGHLKVSGSISSDDLPGLKHKWSVDQITSELNYKNTGDFKTDISVINFSCQGCGSEEISSIGAKAKKQTGLLNKIQKVMKKYHLSGTIDAQVNAEGNYNNLKKTKLNGNIFCKDVSVLYSIFPYQVDKLKGKIAFTEKKLIAKDLSASHGDVKLSMDGEFSNLGPDVKGEVVISSDHMPLDDDLYKALWPSQKLLWEQFRPKGFVEFEYTFSIEAQTEKKFALDVDLINVDSTYEHFPYPLDDLTGNLLFDVDSIVVTNLKSKQKNRIININGNVIDTDTQNPKFDLIVDVNNIPLDEILAKALPEKERNLYNQFSPQGSGSGKILVNNMSSDPNEVYFNAALNFEDTILRPPMLSGDITDINAKGIFEPNKIKFINFKGVYASQPVEMKGEFIPTEEGSDLTYRMLLSSERIVINDQILNLIPVRFKKHIDKIQPSGTFAYSALLTKKPNQNDTDYNVTLRCVDVKLKPEITDIPLEHITGSININKNAFTFTDLQTNPVNTSAPFINVNGQVFLASEDPNETKLRSASITIDSNNFPVETKHLDKLRGTLFYDKEKSKWYSNDLYGEFYDGKLAGKLEIKRRSKKDKTLLMLQVGFNKADLRNFLADTNNIPDDCLDKSCYSTGKMSGQINVTGIAGDLSSFYGSCRVEIEDMQIGRLSPVAKVLTLLKLTQPSDYLFERMFFDTYLRDEKFYFETFELSGAALDFGGTGWMDIKSKELDLNFAARGPRISDISNDLIGSLTSAISPGILQVHVIGDVFKPKVRVKPFPIFGKAFGLEAQKPK